MLVLAGADLESWTVKGRARTEFEVVMDLLNKARKGGDAFESVHLEHAANVFDKVIF